MASKLAFDLNDLRELLKATEKLSDDLTKQKESLMQGLEELRRDWQTPAGSYFFENIDDSWEGDVKKFIETIDVFGKILKDAYEQFLEVQDKANAISINLY